MTLDTFYLFHNYRCSRSRVNSTLKSVIISCCPPDQIIHLELIALNTGHFDATTQKLALNMIAMMTEITLTPTLSL